MTEGQPREESGQLPEEAPAGQGAESESRDDADESAGAADDEGGESTGNPRNAG